MEDAPGGAECVGVGSDIVDAEEAGAGAEVLDGECEGGCEAVVGRERVGLECFERASELSIRVNYTILPEPLSKVVV